MVQNANLKSRLKVRRAMARRVAGAAAGTLVAVFVGMVDANAQNRPGGCQNGNCTGDVTNITSTSDARATANNMIRFNFFQPVNPPRVSDTPCSLEDTLAVSAGVSGINAGIGGARKHGYDQTCLDAGVDAAGVSTPGPDACVGRLVIVFTRRGIPVQTATRMAQDNCPGARRVVHPAPQVSNVCDLPVTDSRRIRALRARPGLCG